MGASSLIWSTPGSAAGRSDSGAPVGGGRAWLKKALSVERSWAADDVPGVAEGEGSPEGGG